MAPKYVLKNPRVFCRDKIRGKVFQMKSTTHSSTKVSSRFAGIDGNVIAKLQLPATIILVYEHSVYGCKYSVFKLLKNFFVNNIIARAFLNTQLKYFFYV